MNAKETVLKTNNHREAEWDVFKGILMIYVIIGHLDCGDCMRHYIYAFHMPLFFLVSGYFYRPSRNLINEWGGVIRKRVGSLIAPYLIMMAINYLAWIVLYNPENIASPLQHIFYVNTTDGLPIAGALWFLTALFFVFLMATLLDRINDDYILIIIVLFAVVGVFISYLPFRLPLGLDCAIEGTAFFEMGYYFRKKQYVKEFLDVQNKVKRNIVSCLALLISIPCIFLNGEVNFRSLEFANLPVTWVNVILSLVAYIGVSKSISERRAGFLGYISWELQFIGRNTLVFLGFHQLTRWFVIRMVNRILFAEFPGISQARMIAYVIGCIAACQVITYIMNRLKWYRKMLHISI